MVKWHVVLLFCWSLFVTTIGLAAVQANTFDASLALEKIQRIDQLLSKNEVAYGEVFQANRFLFVLQTAAETCVKNSREQLAQLEPLLKEMQGVLPDTGHGPINYLNNEKKQSVTQLVTCEYVIYRTKGMQKKINQHLISFNAQDILARADTQWQKFNPLMVARASINPQIFQRYSGADQFDFSKLIVLPIVICVAVLFSMGFTFVCIYLFRIKNQALVRLCKMWLPFITFFGCMSLFIHGLLWYVAPIPSHALLTDALFLYLSALFLIKLYLAVFVTEIQDVKRLSRLMKNIHVLLFILFMGIVAVILARGQPISNDAIVQNRILFFTVLMVSFFNVCSLVFALYFSKKMSKWSLYSVKFIWFTLLIFLILLNWTGYQNFVMFFIPKLMATVLVVFVVSKITQHLSFFYARLNDASQPISRRLREALGVKSDKKLIELFVVKMILNVAVVLWGFFLLLTLWNIPDYYIDLIYFYMKNGIAIANVSLIPVRIVRGIMVFCTVLMIGRVVATYVAHRHTLEGETDRQVSIATLITYVFFAIGLLLGLLIAGVNFTGFAIVAGALSVGIGFGLQNIANDFVSGIIILVNKTVRPGDHVVVDTIEGFIKKIRILSTQITTLEQTDVMIPNSYLINKTIANYTFRNNKYWRVKTSFVLANSEDVERAKKIILDTISKNSQIIHHSPHNPVVLFEPTLFPSGLQFAILVLWCVIKDVDIKHIVTSEINTSLVEALKQQDISIKFS